MIFADRVLAFDHRSASVHACATSPAGHEADRQLWQADTAARWPDGGTGRYTAPFATGPVRAVPDRSRAQYLANIPLPATAGGRRDLRGAPDQPVPRVPVTETGFEVYRLLLVPGVLHEGDRDETVRVSR